MKATIEIPNDLYRRVKAKTALQSRTIREVTISLYLGWVNSQESAVEKPIPANPPPPSWFASAKKYAEKINSHDMDSIRNSIFNGRKGENTPT